MSTFDDYLEAPYHAQARYEHEVEQLGEQILKDERDDLADYFRRLWHEGVLDDVAVIEETDFVSLAEDWAADRIRDGALEPDAD